MNTGDREDRRVQISWSCGSRQRELLEAGARSHAENQTPLKEQRVLFATEHSPQPLEGVPLLVTL